MNFIIGITGITLGAIIGLCVSALIYGFLSCLFYVLRRLLKIK